MRAVGRRYGFISGALVTSAGGLVAAIALFQESFWLFAFALMLIGVTGVDYVGYFEVVYHLLSLSQNKRAIVKVKCGEGRIDPVMPSVLRVWRGAELQEREVYDLMGIRFEGHDDMKRIFLWEGFEGHPHRKDFL